MRRPLNPLSCVAIKPSYESVTQSPNVCLNNSFHPKRDSIHWREAAPYLPGHVTTTGRDVGSRQADACGTCTRKLLKIAMWECV